MSLLARRLLMRQQVSGAPIVSDVFATSLYTGNSLTQTINNGIDLASEGGMVWLKQRTYDGDHTLNSSHNWTVNGRSNTTAGYRTTNNPINSVNTTGFIVTNSLQNAADNEYVAWTFRQAPRFFDVVTVSHTNGAATNISLTDLSTLGLVIAKITNTDGDWMTRHRSLTASNNLRLNTTAAQTTTNAWLSVSGTTATLSASAPTGSYVVYGFAHDPDGVIQCGSYIGNGSTTGSTVTLGWEPQYLLIKNRSATGNWIIYDNARDTANPCTYTLKANTFDAEVTTGNDVDFNATGFQIKATASDINTNANTYIYMAIKKDS